MKQFKLIVTVGYPEMGTRFRDIAREMDINITVVEGVLEEAAVEVERLLRQDQSYEAVISRAGTAQFIKDSIPIPIIHHDSDHFDLLDSFLRAKELGDNICFITYPEKGYLFDFKKIQAALSFPVTFLPYRNDQELIQQTKKAKELGMDVVVGGGIRAAQLVKSLNMKPMFLTSSDRNIKRALNLACKIVQDRLEIKSKAEVLKSVLNVSDDGIIHIDQDQKIVSCNTVAERLFKIKEQTIIGKSIDDLLLDPTIKEIFKRLINGKKEIIHQSIHYNTVPLIIDMESIGTVVICKEVKAIQNLEKKIRRDINKKGLIAKYTFNHLIHKSECMKNLVEVAKSYSNNDATVLIIGESGTGKEVLAQSIHNSSPRKDGPFVALNCAALPESILESELFGYVEGAFTGALKTGRAGVFELAHEGTIFLDEVGEIPLHLQTRLLRVLQERNVMRIGADYITPVNIRIIAATNKNLWELVVEKKFRLDLYFRLSVLHLETPPLKERKEDIPLLVNHMLKEKHQDKTFSTLSTKFQQFLLSYSWPGNIRQLENIIERITHLSNNPDEQIWLMKRIQTETNYMETLQDVVSPTIQQNASAPILQENELIIKEGSLEEIEQQIIQHMMDKHNQNRSVVADLLQISRTTLWKKLSLKNHKMTKA